MVKVEDGKQQKGGRGRWMENNRNVVEVVVQGNNRNVVNVAHEKP